MVAKAFIVLKLVRIAIRLKLGYYEPWNKKTQIICLTQRNGTNIKIFGNVFTYF